MKIALFGATSQIAKDLIVSFSKNKDYECVLFSRNNSAVQEWKEKIGLNVGYSSYEYSGFKKNEHFDAIINFVGVGDPAKTKDMGEGIFDVTLYYDMMILEYLKENSATKYIFLSSGAVYGGDFKDPVGRDTNATIPINNLNASHWYGLAKLYAEARHRTLINRSIIDVRVFNYFSHTQDLNASYLITEMVRACKTGSVFLTSDINIVRDYITPVDFYSLIQSLLEAGEINKAIDCYTQSPIDKFSLLAAFEDKFGLKYEVSSASKTVNATGAKINYYSENKVPNEINYLPQFTSLNGLVEEVKLMKGAG